VIQKTAGWTLFSNRDKSRAGLWLGCGDCAGLGDADEPDDCTEVESGGDCVGDGSPTTWLFDFRPHPVVTKIAKQNKNPRVSGNRLIVGGAETV